MSAVLEGIADYHDLRNHSKRIRDELDRLYFLMDYIEILFSSQQTGDYNIKFTIRSLD